MTRNPTLYTSEQYQARPALCVYILRIVAEMSWKCVAVGRGAGYISVCLTVRSKHIIACLF